MWEIYLTEEVLAWLDRLSVEDAATHVQVVSAIEALAAGGPNLGRPLVDRIKGSRLHNLNYGPAHRVPARYGSCSPSTRGEARSCWSPVTRPVAGSTGTGR